MSDVADTVFARDFSFPLRFTADCDMLMAEDEEVIDQTIQIIVHTRNGEGILNYNLGSQAELVVFDPNDDDTVVILDTVLKEALEQQEPRIFLDQDIVTDESTDGLTIIAILPYRINATGQVDASRISLRKPLG